MKKKPILSILGQAILTYSCIYIIPMVILSVLIYQYVFYQYRENVEKTNEIVVERFSERMEQNFLAMQKIVVEMELENYLILLENDKTKNSLVETVSLLSTFMAGQTDITEMGVWFENGDQVICASGTYTPEFFGKLVTPNVETDIWKTAFSSDSIEIFRLDENIVMDKLMVTYPMGTAVNGTKHCMFFILDVGSLISDYIIYDESIANIIFWEETTDETGNKVKEIFFEEEKMEDIQTILNDIETDNKVQQVNYNGDDVMAFYQSAVMRPYHYLFLFEKEALYSEVNQTISDIVLTIIGCLVLGIVLVAIFVRYNYAPIQQICDYCITLKEKSENKESRKKQQDYALIKDTLESMREQIEETKPLLKRQAMMDMLHASSPQFSSAYAVALEESVLGENGAFAVLIVETKNQMAWLETVIEEFKNKKEEKEENGIESIIINDRLHKQKIILCSMQHHYEKDLQELEETLLEADQSGEMTIGKSDIHFKIEDISNSYLEAITAVSFKFIKGKNRVIGFSEIKNETSSHSVEIEKIANKLIYALAHDDIEGMKRLPDELLSAMTSQAVSLYQGKRVANEIIDAIIKLSIDNEIDYKSYMHLDYDFTQISNFETMEEIIDTIRMILEAAIEKMEARSEGKEREKAEEIKAYIEQKAYDEEFSVEMVADVFGLSYPYLCKFFKNYYRNTISNFVNECRVERAKELLYGSDLAIQDISVNVGYANVVSFNRMFKKSTGVAPMEYRKQSRV